MNKLFFFGDYQGTRRNTGGSALLRVPSAAERQGDLSGLGVDIFDPASGGDAGRAASSSTATGFRQRACRRRRRICSGSFRCRISKARCAISPTTSGSGTVRFNEDLANTRWDYFLSETTHVFGRYSLADYRLDSPGIFGELAGGRGFDEAAPFAGVSRTRNQSLAAGFNHTAQPEPPDRFPVRLVPLPRQRRPGRRQREPGHRCGHRRA